MIRKRNFTRAQLTERIRSIADYTKLARASYGTKSVAYTMQVEILKGLARSYRSARPRRMP